MRLYLHLHFYLFAILVSVILFVTLLFGGFPFGYSLFVNSYLWGGLTGILLVVLYFKHRNTWVLYLNLRIRRFVHLIGAFFVYAVLCALLLIVCGGIFGL